jgi:hypothetical protein
VNEKVATLPFSKTIFSENVDSTMIQTILAKSLPIQFLPLSILFQHLYQAKMKSTLHDVYLHRDNDPQLIKIYEGCYEVDIALKANL